MTRLLLVALAAALGGLLGAVGYVAGYAVMHSLTGAGRNTRHEPPEKKG